MTLLYSTHTNFSHFPTSLPVPMASSTSNEKLWYYNRETLFYLSTKEAALKLFLKGSYLDWPNFVNFNSPTYMIKLIGKKGRNKGKGEKIWMSEKNLNLHLKPPAPPPPIYYECHKIITTVKQWTFFKIIGQKSPLFPPCKMSLHLFPLLCKLRAKLFQHKIAQLYHLGHRQFSNIDDMSTHIGSNICFQVSCDWRESTEK